MNRKWAKKVKAVPACKAKRQVQTSAAMIGLIVSTGASNLLLTRPSDSAPAPEPFVKEPTTSKVSATTDAMPASSVNLVEPKVEHPVAMVPSFSPTLIPSSVVQLKTETVATPVQIAFVQEETEQKLKHLSQPTSVDAAVPKPANTVVPESLSSRIATVRDRTTPNQPNQQTEKVLRTLRLNRLVRQLKHSQIANTPKAGAALSASLVQGTPTAQVNRSQLTTSAVKASPESVPDSDVTLSTELEKRTLTREAKSDWTPKQKLLINYLKAKSNRLQDSLASLRLEQSKLSTSVVASTQKSFSYQQVETANQDSTAFVPSLSEPQGIKDIGVTSQGQNVELPVSYTPTQYSLHPGVKTPSYADSIVVGLPRVVNQPTMVVPVVPFVPPDYQVKAGDTLTAIAAQHKLPLSEVIKANRLDDPNRLQINQKIKIPLSPSSSTGSRLQKSQQFQIASTYSGMGGNISDDDSVQTSPQQGNNTQQAQSAVAQQALPSNPYVQNLRADIEKLRQKYNTQSTLISQAMPEANIPSTPAPATITLEKLRQQSSAPAYPRSSKNHSAKALQPSAQQLRPTPVKTNEAATGGRNIATVPIGTDAAALPSFRQQSVFPALPPLGTVDTYLPKPNSVSYKGYIWPARGKFTSGYGWRWGRMHRGIDIAGPVGTPIVASAAGVVVKAGWNSGGYGNLVDVQHVDGTVTRYAHNKRILVQTGQVVQQGQQISEMGNTGFSTGPHLHFELHRWGKKAVNPIAYLSR